MRLTTHPLPVSARILALTSYMARSISPGSSLGLSLQVQGHSRQSGAWTPPCSDCSNQKGQLLRLST